MTLVRRQDKKVKHPTIGVVHGIFEVFTPLATRLLIFGLGKPPYKLVWCPAEAHLNGSVAVVSHCHTKAR